MKLKQLVGVDSSITTGVRKPASVRKKMKFAQKTGFNPVSLLGPELTLRENCERRYRQQMCRYEKARTIA